MALEQFQVQGADGNPLKSLVPQDVVHIRFRSHLVDALRVAGR